MKMLFQIVFATAIGAILIWLLFKFAETLLAHWLLFGSVAVVLLIVSVIFVKRT